MSKYDAMTTEDFDRHLALVLKDMTPEAILMIPGVYDVLAEELNNAALDSWAQEQQEKKDAQ